MFCYDSIDVSEGIDVNNPNAWKECDVCHSWYFFNYSFKFQPDVCNRCMISINLNDIAILNIKGCDYCYIISIISKNEAINLLQNADLTEKSGAWQNIKVYIKAEHYKTLTINFQSIKNKGLMFSFTIWNLVRY